MVLSVPDILVVDDDPLLIQVLGTTISKLGSVRFATCGAEALRLARERAPDLVLLDAEMPGMSGFEVCRTLKADDSLRHVPVVFVTANGGLDFELASFEAGAGDFIVKPFSAPLVLARVQTQLQVKQLTDELRRTASLDALTQLCNRGCFDELLGREWKRADRDGSPLSVAMIDVDHFKLFNDRYGHPAGDTALRMVASALKEVCQRPGDMAARVGGEEFGLILPGTDAAGGMHVLNNVLSAVRSLAVPHAASPTAPHLTISAGLASLPQRLPLDSKHSQARTRRATASELVAEADRALYAAKDGGRNRAHPVSPQVPAEQLEWAPRA